MLLSKTNYSIPYQILTISESTAEPLALIVLQFKILTGLGLGGSTGLLLFVYLPFRLIVGSIFGYLCRVEMTITTIGIMKIMKI